MIFGPLSSELLSSIKHKVLKRKASICCISSHYPTGEQLSYAIYCISTNSAIRLSDWFSTYEELLISIALNFPQASVSKKNSKRKHYNRVCKMFDLKPIYKIEKIFDTKN